MQQYPPAQTFQPRPQPIVGLPLVRPPANTRGSSKTYPAPCIKYTNPTSTRAVRGDSTVESSDSDEETVAAFTTTSIASSHSRAPGNKPKQQRRVMNWVNDTSHYSSKFKSPFVPPSGSTNKPASSSAHTHRSADHHSSHDHRGKERELPPVWVPRQTAQHPPRHAVSQPVVLQQPVVQQPAVQYPPPQPMQYVQPPQAVWMPAPPATTSSHES
ncbi:hypothetical protein MSAN_01619700 [Mycena sanguinolenta]|uniref:Uncharacterized protein n=1 Tax=Mycena sanguinolenta TaxID=230812 RepID=A0A8H6Y1Q4_9AGAR|nr:hypothetical protein MSAN_01619700 [Mycena sanguinolenta]